MGDMLTFYPEFRPNQILTDAQLNRLREHLELQDRHTRLRLAGTGIVCGFAYERDGTTGAITIRKGCGIPSDGDLIERCEDIVYTHYRAYKDPALDEEQRIRYVPWRRPTDPKQQRDIVELIDKATMDGGDPPQGVTKLAPGGHADRVLVLYLEHQPVDLNSCLITSCDNKGLNINVNLRALLVKEADLTALAGCPTVPDLLRVQRLHTQRLPQNIGSAADLANAFGTIIAAHAPTLQARIAALFAAHGGLLDLSSPNTANLVAKLSGAQPAQYRYDALGDLAAACNEVALGAYSLVAECCPAGDFPRHLMLGAIDKVPPTGYRHEFRPAALRNVMQGDWTRVRDLFRRLGAMTTGLNLDAAPGVVSIQPSHTAEYPLGRRAVPYYFGTIDPEVWRPRGHCAADPDWPWRRPAIAVGLATDYAEADFLRIEGHVGKTHSAAITDVRTKRDAGNAEFHVLRSYFNDRQVEEGSRLKKILDWLEAPLNTREIALEAVMHLIEMGSGDFAAVAMLAVERLKRLEGLEEGQKAWLDVRNQRELHCHASALGEEYLQARGELSCAAARLLGMLHRLRAAIQALDAKLLVPQGLQLMLAGAAYMLADRIVGALLAAPQGRDKVDGVKALADWGAFPKMPPVERLRRALLFALDALEANTRMLLKSRLPLSLAAFNPDMFAAQHRETARSALELLLWLRALGSALDGAVPGMPADVPLHTAELSLVEADLLTLARSCLPTRLAAIYVAYEGLRARDPSLFKNLRGIDGLEHLAGVAKGGTFVLVCDTSAAGGTVLADLSLEGCIPCCCEVDLDKLCLPPLAMPDLRVVRLRRKGEGFEPLDLQIAVRANDYEPNGDEPPPQIELRLPLPHSELGAKLSEDSAKGTIRYQLAKPICGVVDRFSYQLHVKGRCSGEATAEVAIVLAIDAQPQGRIEGKVIDDSKNFIGGATVTVIGKDFTAVTDGNGHFTIDLVPPGGYTLQAAKGAAKSDTVQVIVSAEAVAQTALVLKVAPTTGTIVIRVRDKSSGALLPGAQVKLEITTGAQPPRNSSTGANGEAVFGTLPVGSYTAFAILPGFIGDSVGPFPLAGGETVGKELFLSKATVSVPVATVENFALVNNLRFVEARLEANQILDLRLKEYVNIFNGATDDPKIRTSAPYAGAINFIAESLSDPGKTEAQLAADYKQASTALVAAAKQATGQDKVAYQQALEATSLAYLDRIATENPKSLSDAAGAEVKKINVALKAAGADIDRVQEQWNGDALKAGVGVKSIGGMTNLLG